MNRILLFIVMFCAIHSSVWGQVQGQNAEGIKFENGTWNEVLQKARQTKKPLFVDVWASWCGPCKRLAREVFTLPEVGKHFNENFICYKLQIDPKDSIQLEKALAIADLYQVKALPTLLWLNSDGELMQASTGYISGGKLIETARQAVDEKNNTSAILKRWEQGDRSLATGLTYFDVNRDSLNLFDDFYLALSESDKLNTELMYKMMFGMKFTPQSRTLQYIANHWNDVYQKDSTASSWEQMLKNTLEDSFYSAKTDEECDRIEALYSQLPYTPICRDMAHFKKMSREGDYDGCFMCLEKMAGKYDDFFYMHALTINLGYALVEGKLDNVMAPAAFTGWIERLIDQKGMTGYWPAYYRTTSAALLRDRENTTIQYNLLMEELQKSSYDNDFKESIRKHADKLLQASQRD